MANARSLNGLIRWLGRDEWREPFEEVLDRHLLPACEAADVEVEEVISTLGPDSFMATVWASAFEDFLTREIDGRNIVDDYLKRRGWKESASTRQYMLALRNSVMSLYEVSDIVRDNSFLARDLVRGGEPVRISERSATHSLHQWDHIATRVVRLGSTTVISGCVLELPQDVSEDAVRLVRRTARRIPAARRKLAEVVGCSSDDARLDDAFLDTVLLQAAAPGFTTLWLNDILHRAINPPEVQNSDGDEIIFCTVRFPLAANVDVADIQSALDKLPDLRRENATFWNWVDAGKASKSRPAQKHPQPTDATTFVTKLDDGAIVLGNIELKNESLVLTTNSRRRADRGQALIAKTITSLVGPPLTEMQTLEQMRRSRVAEPSPPPPEIAPDQQQLIVHAYLDKHYRELLDKPVPMLGNMSPRKAVQSAKNRRKVVTWLKTLENYSAKIADRTTPVASYDSTWLWTELGISDLRQ
jgi:hypothetical protein